MSEWQPIETAPDGECEILIWDGSCNVANHGWEEGGRVVWMVSGEFAVRGATHWMPLPEPPK